ncbi:MAG: hypothetical protein SFY66_07415 [Oculatellaceae cyanobacterium bins.114]|nr:hypothetical protein [Oculatellaceae cyanobacterium bins.114]
MCLIIQNWVNLRSCKVLVYKALPTEAVKPTEHPDIFGKSFPNQCKDNHRCRTLKNRQTLYFDQWRSQLRPRREVNADQLQ